MKRFISFIALVLLAGSCDETGREDLDFLRSYLPHYNNGPWVAYSFVESPAWISLWMQGGESYDSPDVGGRGESAQKFLQIAERNGDMSYNRRDRISNYASRSCCADNFRALRIVCLNADWDDTHPAGTSLGDIAVAKGYTYAPYVRSGYTSSKTEGGIRKYISELSENDLAMISPQFEIVFDNQPASGTYEVQVTLVTTQGEEKVATCTFDFN